MSDVRAAAIGGIIAMAGLLLGTWVEKWLDKDNFDHSFQVQSRNDLVLKRYQIISDFSNQINSSDYVKILHTWNDVVAKVGPIATKICESSTDNEVDAFDCLHKKIMLDSLNYRSAISERNAKFIATTQMAGLLFGPEVSGSLQKIDRTRWWETKEDMMVEVLSSMRKELFYFEE
jgi:hypothetical protein